MWAGVKAASTLLFVERDGDRRVGTHGVTSPLPPPPPPAPRCQVCCRGAWRTVASLEVMVKICGEWTIYERGCYRSFQKIFMYCLIHHQYVYCIICNDEISSIIIYNIAAEINLIPIFYLKVNPPSYTRMSKIQMIVLAIMSSRCTFAILTQSSNEWSIFRALAKTNSYLHNYRIKVKQVWN